jgi:hypothetical protein
VSVVRSVRVGGGWWVEEDEWRKVEEGLRKGGGRVEEGWRKGGRVEDGWRSRR